MGLTNLPEPLVMSGVNTTVRDLAKETATIGWNTVSLGFRNDPEIE